MASTKYRKREKSEAAVDAKKLQESKPIGTNNKILDSSGPSIADERTKQQAMKENLAPLLEVKPDLSFTQEESDVEVGDEQVLDRIAIEDKNNIIEIKLLKKVSRLTRVAFFLNGIEIRPHTYAGNNAGSSYFRLLKMTKKEGAQNV